MDLMMEGIVNSVLQEMDRDIEAELHWSDFIEFMDKATDEHKRLFKFFKGQEWI